MKKKRVVITVWWRKKDKMWISSSKGGDVNAFRIKADAMKHCQMDCEIAVARGELAQMVVKAKTGKIQIEYTYPRSSDPKRSKG